MSGATIRLEDLQMVAFAARMRRYNRGRTCQLCAMSAAPTVQVDCGSYWNRPDAEWIARARRSGEGVRCTPLQRGHIAHLYERTAREHGRREVLRTWGAGIRSLRAEPRYVLHGGAAA